MDLNSTQKKWDDIEREIEKAQKCLEIAGVIIVVIDSDQRVSLINKKGCEVLGYQQEDIVGKVWFDHFLPERLRAEVKGVFKKLIAGEVNGVEYFENPVLTKNGEERIIEWHNTVLRDKTGNITGTLSSGSDITGREQIDEALKKNTERLRTFIEHTTDAIFCYEYDPPIPTDLPLKEQVKKMYDCYLVECNDICVRAYGAENRKDVLGLKLKELFGTIPGSLDELFTALVQNGYRIIDGEGVDISENGTERYYLNNAHGVIEDGKLVRVWGTFRDITERKRTEESLKIRNSAIHSAINAIAFADLEGKLTYVNPSFLKHWGYDDQKEVLGNNAIKFWQMQEKAQEVVMALFERGSFEGEIIAERKDGSFFDVQLSASMVTDDVDKPICMMASFIDITERKKAEKELLKSQKLESLGILAGGIAHDFNNLLTGIIGNISLAKDSMKPEDKVFARLVEADKASLMAANLTQQLLTFSKGGAPIKETTSIRGLIEDSVAFALRGSQVRCECSIPDDLWPVESDEGQISQVINNLIMNADQAMPEGGTIKVRCENIIVGEEDINPIKTRKHIKIEINDEGVGIPEEHLQKIFDPYFTTKERGSGLGLATAYSIIKRHGGLITVDSETGAGTTFCIYLPASDKKLVEKKEPEILPRTGEGRILVMDDDVIVRDVAVEMLRQLGYEAEIALDGKEAIEIYTREKASGRPFDAVIMDLTIAGGMGGKEAIKKLLEIDPDVKAIVSSGYSNDPMMTEYKRHGFRGIMAKPYKLRTLSEIVHRVIKGES